MNHVELFHLEYADDVEERINQYCRNYRLNPRSISAVKDGVGGMFVFVVVEEMEVSNG